MKRALFLCPSPYDIGTYHRAFAFARHFVAAGICEVDLLCTGKAGIEIKEGVRIVRVEERGPSLLPMRGWNPGEILARIAFLIRHKTRYDFVYSFEYQPNVMALGYPIARVLRVPHFNDWCDWYAGRHHKMRGIKLLQKIDAWMEEFPRRRMDLVTVICQSLYDRALQSGVPPERLFLVREGANRYGGLVSRNEARSKLKLGSEDFVIVAMADQDNRLPVKAVELLAAKRSGAKLVMFGKGISPSASTALLTPGRVSDEELHLWLCAADCAWLPLENSPLNEGRLPHKIGHFRMYGIPLITTSVSDAPHLGDSGIFLAEYSAESFANATMGMQLLHDSVRVSSMKVAEQIYNWDRVLECLTKRVRAAIS